MNAWIRFLETLARHPAQALALAGCGIATAWGLHIWRLRKREAHLLALVEERTRLWQGEVAARVESAAVSAPVPAGLPPEEDQMSVHPVGDDLVAASSAIVGVDDRAARVLVVDERRDRRSAVLTAFDGLGIKPVFADSPWAARVATSQAEADGQPYDLILIDSTLEGSGDPRAAL